MPLSTRPTLTASGRGREKGRRPRRSPYAAQSRPPQPRRGGPGFLEGCRASSSCPPPAAAACAIPPEKLMNFTCPGEGGSTLCAAKWWPARPWGTVLRRIRALVTQRPDHSRVMGLAQVATENWPLRLPEASSYVVAPAVPAALNLIFEQVSLHRYSTD